MSQANSLSSSLLLEKQEERPGIRDRNENSIISGNRQQTHSGRTSYRAKARKMISNSNVTIYNYYVTPHNYFHSQSVYRS